MVDKFIGWLNNRYLIAIVVGLFLLSIVKTFSRRA